MKTILLHKKTQILNKWFCFMLVIMITVFSVQSQTSWPQLGQDIEGGFINEQSGKSVDFNAAGNIVVIGVSTRRRRKCDEIWLIAIGQRIILTSHSHCLRCIPVQGREREARRVQCAFRCIAGCKTKSYICSRL